MLNYTLKRFKGQKVVRVQVKASGEVLVTAPKRVSALFIDEFVAERADWIGEQQAKLKSKGSFHLKIDSKEHYAEHKALALRQLRARVKHWSGVMGLKPTAVGVRKVSSRWGSCSSNGKVNFCYKLIFLPVELQDYVVVHELAHLEEMNHSPAFWAIVGRALPGYEELRKKLKES